MKSTKKLIFSALFLAIGLVLPFLTMQIPQIGKMLLPMHIPVLICGFICGWKYGLAVGIIVPLLRSLMFSMPPMPSAIAMAFELAAYGAVSGAIHEALRGKTLARYISLICAMLAGRLVWGVASLVIYNIIGKGFTWQLFAAGAFLQAIPGIALQLIIVPPIVALLQQRGYLNEDKKKSEAL